MTRLRRSTEYSLDLLGPVIMAMRDDVAEIKRRVTAFKGKVDQHHDEITVLTGLVRRAAGEPIAWGGVQGQLRRLSERLDALERKAP